MSPKIKLWLKIVKKSRSCSIKWKYHETPTSPHLTFLKINFRGHWIFQHSGWERSISLKECLSRTKPDSTRFRKTTWNSTAMSKSSKVLQITQNSRKNMVNKLSSFHKNLKKKKSRGKNSENFLIKLSFRRTSLSTKFILQM